MDQILKPLDEFNVNVQRTFLPLFGLEAPPENTQQPGAAAKDEQRTEQKADQGFDFFGLFKGEDPAPSAASKGGSGAAGITACGLTLKVRGSKDVKKYEVVGIDPKCESSKLGVKEGDFLTQIGIIEVKALSESEVVELIEHTISLGEKLRLTFLRAEKNRKDKKNDREKLEILVNETSTATDKKNALPFMEDWKKKQAESAEEDDEDHKGGGEYV